MLRKHIVYRALSHSQTVNLGMWLCS